MTFLLVLVIVAIIVLVKGTSRFLVGQLGNQKAVRKLNVDITHNFLRVFCLVVLVVLIWSVYKLANYSAWPTTPQFCAIHCLSSIGAYAVYLSFSIAAVEALVISLPYLFEKPSTK